MVVGPSRRKTNPRKKVDLEQVQTYGIVESLEALRREFVDLRRELVGLRQEFVGIKAGHARLLADSTLVREQLDELPTKLMDVVNSQDAENEDEDMEG